MGILLLNRGESVSGTARSLQASRSSVRDWRSRYEQYGEAGLILESRGRREETVNEALCAKLLELVQA